ncbi:accessory factor UbiK family protein [Sphingomonas sp. MMS24-J13]|uniref:accessory factor UbiK family protein n=1 Tax=Sphingomonas sp. MMS24-J13 TaxID=3238686 RepID=UPI003850DEEC
MQSDNKIFEDFVKMANGFAGTMAGAAREGENAFKEKVKAWVGGMDFVSREEFEAVKAMAAAARDDVEALKAELAAVKGKAKSKGAAPDDETPPPGAGI